MTTTDSNGHARSDIDWSKYPSFKASEFTCKCGCGSMNIRPELLSHLQAMRDMLGFPLNITSGCRCKAYNAKVGGVSQSSHVRGLAVDIACTDSRKRYRIIDAAMSVGIRRIGIAKTFIHLDVDQSLPQEVAWQY